MFFFNVHVTLTLTDRNPEVALELQSLAMSLATRTRCTVLRASAYSRGRVLEILDYGQKGPTGQLHCQYSPLLLTLIVHWPVYIKNSTAAQCGAAAALAADIISASAVPDCRSPPESSTMSRGSAPQVGRRQPERTPGLVAVVQLGLHPTIP